MTQCGPSVSLQSAYVNRRFACGEAKKNCGETSIKYRIVKNITSTILIAVEEGLVPVGARIILCQLRCVAVEEGLVPVGVRIILCQLGHVSPLRKASYL